MKQKIVTTLSIYMNDKKIIALIALMTLALSSLLLVAVSTAVKTDKKSFKDLFSLEVPF